jgi:hypothetical protein
MRRLAVRGAQSQHRSRHLRSLFYHPVVSTKRDPLQNGRRRRRCLRAGVYVLLVFGLLLWLGGCMLWMPGKSYDGPLPAASDAQQALATRLRGDVVMLAETIGPRGVSDPDGLRQAVAFIERSLRDAGYEPARQTFTCEGVEVANIEAEIAGADKADEVVVIGAHYDSVARQPGANDNATGVAAVLELARRFAGAKPARTLRFVLFVNEEPPWFQTELMGSMVYAGRCRQRGEDIAAMVSFDGIGSFSDAPGSQNYPFPFNLAYPSTANFIGIVGNTSSGPLVRRVVGTFREHAQFPSQGGAVPAAIPGVGFSDHWSFWQHGYPGVLVTDTLPFRYEHYHTAADTPDKIDFDRASRVVDGMEHVVRELAGAANETE